MADQIFISYSKKNGEYVSRIYERLLWDGYLVWMDKRIEEGKEWRPQIDHALKTSDRFVVFISPEAIDSHWVKHEISMACGRDVDIVPVKIKDYQPLDLPIGIEPIQLLNFVEGQSDFEREIRKLEHRLGPPVPIVKYMEDLLILYETSGKRVLLPEHALRLYEKHKKIVVWPPGKEALGLELVEKSYRALQDYWNRYTDLEQRYMHAKVQIDQLHRKLDGNSQFRKSFSRLLSPFLILLVLLIALYMALYISSRFY